MEIIPLGDSALIVRLREQFEHAPAETLNEVLRAFQQLRKSGIPGVIELAPAYTSVAMPKRVEDRMKRLIGWQRAFAPL